MLFTEPNIVWIILVILFNVFDQNLAAYLRCYRTSFTDYTEVPLTSPDSLITDSAPCIDKEKSTMVLCNGFNNDVEQGPAITTLISTYVSLGRENVVLLNWEKESKGIGLGPLGYPSAVRNSMTVGIDLATAMVRLVELGMSRNIHFIGHSLGAQLLGYSGRECIKQNLTIPWLTALDPARQGFDPEIYYPSVDTTSASFVDVEHCDPGGYGLKKPTGHLDIYPNYGFYLNGTRRQPGCSSGFSLEELGTGGNRCSHDRCWQYYNISLTNPELFMVGKASNYHEWVEQSEPSDITYLGPEVDKELTALDPARPGFDPELLYPAVDTTSAAFVEVEHCDPGGYGLNKSTGHMDIYFNYGSYLDGTERQPGCTTGFTPNELGSGGNSCSHNRCWQYYNVSLTNPEIFMVGKASNYYEWVEQSEPSDITYLGPEVDKEQRGNYFISTSDTQPWGIQEAGLKPQNT